MISNNGYKGNYDFTHALIAHSKNWVKGNASATSTKTNYYAGAPNNSLTYESWKASAYPATWALSFSTSMIDYCCILGEVKGETISIEIYNGSWNEAVEITPIDNAPIMAVFPAINATQAQITVTGGKYQVIRFGKIMQIPRPIYGGHSPLDLARQTILRQNISETGEFLGRTKQRTQLATDFSWQHIPANWIRDNWNELQIAIEDEPFFIAWRPETFSEVGYCYSDNTPIPNNMGIKDLMSVDMSVRGYAYS